MDVPLLIYFIVKELEQLVAGGYYTKELSLWGAPTRHNLVNHKALTFPLEGKRCICIIEIGAAFYRLGHIK
jgi:hypothetical protein